MKLLISNLCLTKVWKKLPGIGQVQFYMYVKNNGKWDYKVPCRQPSWAKSGRFKAFGKTITTEQLGNLNYGFTGASMGFSPAVLFAGGGFVAIRNGGTSWKDWEYYFDQKNDHLWISVGIYAYASFDLKYRLSGSFKYAIEKKVYTLCLSVVKAFRKK